MLSFFACLSLLLLSSFASAQQEGTNTPEVHPALPSQQCTMGGGCQTVQTSIVLDSNWRWVHNVGGYTNCFTGNAWNTTLCPDPVTCATNCALEGVNYQGTYGITTSGSELQINFVTYGGGGKNVGSRNYLMQDDSTYQIFQLKNQEFTFDVDVSNLPCGLNGALYFVEMSADGGVSQYPGNKAGAKYGTGYCDAQCPQDIKFINGEANLLDWQPSPVNPNTGTGMYGTCCVEMDVWEANSMSAALTPHVCTVQGQTRCNGTACGAGANRYDGWCDHDGCDFNSYRMNDKTYYGQGMTVDTSQPFTVVTQYFTTDNTSSGDLSEIRRLYIQNGQVIQNSKTNFSGLSNTYDSITDDFCTDQKSLFGDPDDFGEMGGLKVMGEALDRGMVLVMSLWDDYAAYMLWLDSDYPTIAPPTQPGVPRGSCSISSGRPSDVENNDPNSYVKFSNIKWGDIGSTY